MFKALGLTRPETRAWAMYDWANSAFYTIVVTAFFPVYFQQVVAADLSPEDATDRFSLVTSLAMGAAALLSPVLGAMADYRAVKKKLLLAFTALGVFASAAMYWLGRGDLIAALGLFFVANVAVAAAMVFYDGLLPHVAHEDEYDRVSTAGYALGYVGGGVLLVLNLACYSRPEWFGLPHGEGLSPAQSTLPVRLAFLSVAVWWALFTLPLLRHVGEPARLLEADERPGLGPVRTAFTRLGETLRALKLYKHALLMLLAFLLYSDGIGTIIRLATSFGAQRHIELETMMLVLVAVQFVGIPCAWIFGKLAGRFGSKRILLFGIGVYALICVLAFRMQTARDFWVLGLLVASVQGGTQALSRSLFASLVPKHKSAEFFAFFSVSEKFAGLFGPLCFYLASKVLGSSQWAILSLLLFFLAGAWLLSRVDVAAGRSAARAADEGLRPAAIEPEAS